MKELINSINEREERNMNIFRHFKWFKVESEDVKSYKIVKLMDDYDNLISDVVDIIPMSAVLGYDTFEMDDEGRAMLNKAMKSCKDCLGLVGRAFDVMIEQDNMIREIKEQNTEILKKLDELSKKTK
mgnify:CR=1 FL=1